MSRVRRLLFPALILGLVALAAFGVRQVMVGRTQPDPQAPGSREEEQQRFEAETEWQREAVRQFIASGGDVCSLAVYESSAFLGPGYPDLPTLVNYVDLIVVGRAVENVLEAPQPRTIVGRVLTTVQVDDVVSGSPPGPTILLESSHRVEGGKDLGRGSTSEFDVCDPGPVLLFLLRSPVPGEVIVSRQSWVRIDGDTVVATSRASRDKLYQGYASAQALLDAVRQIAQEQQAQGLPKGLLMCESNRASPDRADPMVCPGETFNPYQALQLESAGGAWVATTEPGPSPREVASVKLEPGDPQLSALLSGLDIEVELEAGGVPLDDIISLSVELAESVRDPPSFSFDYSPSTGIIQILYSSGGQFAAPPAFQQAMAPFLASE